MLAQQNDFAGFLPTRGGFMLDVVFVAMFAIVPLLALSLYRVRFQKRYAQHKTIQIVLAVVLLVAVLAFEIDVRFFTDWEALAAPSPYYEPEQWNLVWYSLIIHLFFAVPTLFLWIYVVGAALWFFPRPPRPSSHSRTHRFWARLAAVGMTMTAVTGWVFYWLAFVA